MKKKIRAFAVLILCLFSAVIFACANTSERWHSPMLSVDIKSHQITTYTAYSLADLNKNGVSPAALLESTSVTKATLSLSYKGDEEYKARINVRIDEVEVEDDGSIGHSVSAFGISKEHVAVIHYAGETWLDGAYGSSAATGGDTLFNSNYYSETDPQYSESRCAILLNAKTAQSHSTIDFYVIGLIDGYYVLNFYVEEADSHGHFHGLNKLALTSVVITVGQPSSGAAE